MKISPRKILFLFLVWPLACRAELTSQGVAYPEKDRDGSIPMVNVQMLPSNRWKHARVGLENIKKELSFIIDKEFEKEKEQLFDKVDRLRRGAPSISQMRLLQYRKDNRYKV